jgi:hypothetical protein
MIRRIARHFDFVHDKEKTPSSQIVFIGDGALHEFFQVVTRSLG